MLRAWSGSPFSEETFAQLSIAEDFIAEFKTPILRFTLFRSG